MVVIKQTVEHPDHPVDIAEGTITLKHALKNQ
jgi:hypothetical protein